MSMAYESQDELAQSNSNADKHAQQRVRRAMADHLSRSMLEFFRENKAFGYNTLESLNFAIVGESMRMYMVFKDKSTASYAYDARTHELTTEHLTDPTDFCLTLTKRYENVDKTKPKWWQNG